MRVQLSRRRKKPGSRYVAASLAVATCSLLNASVGRSIAEEEKKWFFDTAVLYYDEQDRVSDVSANILVRRAFTKARSLLARLSYDTLTGASASGAVPAGTPQTFTSPSARSTYTTPAGEIPLDPTFLDTRVGLTVNWHQPFGATEADFGASFSTEYDYLHTGLNAGFSRDFNQHNTTLSGGFAFASDIIDPVGGAPLPLAPMLPPGDTSNKGGTESKTVTDLLFGVTQVLGPRTVAQFNYSYSYSSGYLTDPYKLVSVVDPVTGDPAPGPGGLNLYLFEDRPDSRGKHSLFAQVKRHLKRDIVDGSYRFMIDDWDVISHTIDFRYRWQLGGYYIQPHVRFYTQSAAQFYRGALFQGDSLPDHVSADYRIGEFDAWTLGVKYGRLLDDDKEWGIRIEYYKQTGRSPPDISVGSLRDFDLDYGIDALIIQAGYTF